MAKRRDKFHPSHGPSPLLRYPFGIPSHAVNVGWSPEVLERLQTWFLGCLDPAEQALWRVTNRLLSPIILEWAIPSIYQAYREEEDEEAIVLPARMVRDRSGLAFWKGEVPYLVVWCGPGQEFGPDVTLVSLAGVRPAHPALIKRWW